MIGSWKLGIGALVFLVVLGYWGALKHKADKADEYKTQAVQAEKTTKVLDRVITRTVVIQKKADTTTKQIEEIKDDRLDQEIPEDVLAVWKSGIISLRND